MAMKWWSRQAPVDTRNSTDTDYSEAGARIAPDARSVYDNDVILKVAPPQEAELEHMRDRQTIFSGLQLATRPEAHHRKNDGPQNHGSGMGLHAGPHGHLPSGARHG